MSKVFLFFFELIDSATSLPIITIIKKKHVYTESGSSIVGMYLLNDELTQITQWPCDSRSVLHAYGHNVGRKEEK